MSSVDTTLKSRTNPANTTTSPSRQTSPNRSATGGNASVSEDRIACWAYEIWERAGRPEGQSELHWRQAEEELRRA